PSVSVSPPVTQSQRGYSVTYTSTEVCVLRGSTVDITSSYSYPGSVNRRVTTVQESFWFIKESNGVYVDLRSDPDYSGRVEYLNEDRKSTLRIRDLRESDSAEYKFRFVTNQDGGKFTGDPGVTLSVRDPQLQIDVRRSVGQFSTWTQLTCHSSCQLSDHFSYVWYKNGQRAGGKNYLHFDNISPTDSFDCTIEGHEQIRSPPVCESINLFYFNLKRKIVSVKIHPPGQIMEGSSVTLTCSSDANPAANYTWYKENTVISTEQNFTITNVTTEHGGNYQCEVQNRVGRQNTTKHLVVRLLKRFLCSVVLGVADDKDPNFPVSVYLCCRKAQREVS
uniref:Ig-like domain-containing protein n=1 Tax=Cynoglossus semilaevis TaxID=244447 RepID=A0A3P8X565_CYNSE